MATLPNLSPEIIKAYQDEIARNASPATAKRKAISLNRFFDWAEDAGHIPQNPMSPNAPKASPSPFVVGGSKKGKVSVKTWAIVGVTGAMAVLVFLLLQQLKLPIPFTINFAQESKIQTIGNTQISPTPSGTSASNPANSAVIAGWNLYAKLKLTSADGTPQIGAQTLSFKVYNSPTDSTPLYTSSPQSIITDSNGSVLISLSDVPTNLFFQNNQLFLEPELSSGSASARIPIETANTAANLGGYFPANPEAGAGPETVPVLDSTGSLNLASQSPAVKATAGNLLIEGQTVTVKATDGSGGNIEINPDANGYAHFLFEGNKGNFLNAQAPNLTSGSLYYGMVPNNATGYDLIKLQNGAPRMTTKFEVDALGNTKIAGDLYTGGVDRLTSTGALENITGYSQTSGNFTITQNPGDFASINKTLTSGGALSDVLTLTLDERGKPATANSDYSTLVLNRYDGGPTAAALKVANGNAIFDGQVELGRFASNPTAIGQGSIIFNTTDSQLYFWNGSSWVPVGTASTVPFSGILSGTNTTAAMVVGTGASLTYSGSGTINASSLEGATWEAPGTIGSTTPNTGAFTTLQVTGLTPLKTVFTDAGSNLTTTGTVAANQGGTGFSSYTVGDLLYADTASTLARLNDVATGQVLKSGGVGAPPAYGQVILGTDTTGNYVSSITGTANQIDASSPTGNVTLSIPSDFRAPGTVNATNGLYTGAAGGGAGTQRIDASGNLLNIGTTQFNTVVYTWPGVDGSNGQVLSTNGLGTLSWTTVLTDSSVFWAQDAVKGILYPKNNSVDVLIGADPAATNATASAKFAFINVDSANSPTASIAGSPANPFVATYLTGDGTLSTTNAQGLTLGSSTTGNVVINSRGSAALTANGADLTATGTLTFPNTNTLTGVAGYLQNSQGFAVGGSTTYHFDSTGNLTANTVATGGVQRIDASGNLTSIGTTQLNGTTYTWPGLGTQSPNFVLQTNGAGTLSWVDPTIAVASTIYWTQDASRGILYPKNNSVDVLIGANSAAANATASAKFAFLNVDSANPPTASIAGSTANVATFIDGNGNISSTNRNNLTLGNSSTYDSTGNVLINPNGTGNLGIGTALPTSTLDITDAKTTSGNVVNVNSTAITNGNILNISESGAQTFSQNVIKADINAGSLGSFTGNFLDFYNAGTEVYKVDSGGNIAAAGNAAINGGTISTTALTANLFNTNATTVNIAGGATIGVNIGPGGATATSVNLAGGSTATGCTVDGATGNFTCTGIISGGTIVATSMPFSGITTGTNNSATMTVDTGATLTYSNSGVINASQLEGKTWEAPGTIGSTTPNTGVFTSLTGDNLLVNKYATVSASLALGNTNASAGPGNLDMTGNLTTGGTASVSGNLTLGNGSALQSAYGPLTLNYKNGANTWLPSIVIHDVSGNIDLAGGFADSGCTIDNTSGTITCTGGIAATSIPFSGITTGTNNSATMTVDTGATLTYSNLGVINASQLEGKTWEAPGTIGSTTPNTGVFTTLTANNLLVNQYATVSASLALGNTNAAAGPGNLNMTGNLVTGGTATIAGILTVGNGTTNQIQSPYGPLVLNYKSGANTWTPGITLSDITGNVALANNLAIGGTNLTSTGSLNITPGGALTVGATGQNTTLQGAVTTITSNGVGNNIILNSANTIELQDNTNITGNLDATGTASISGNLTIGNGSAIQSAYGPLTLNYKSGADTWTPSIVIHDVSGNIDLAGGFGSTGCTIDNSIGTITCTAGISATAVAFTNITTGTNTTATMTVGTGATLTYSGSGVINASQLEGATWEAPGTIGSTTPNTGAFTTLTSSGNSTIGTGASTTNTFGAGASSVNTIGSTTTPGALTLHGATTLDNTASISGVVTIGNGTTNQIQSPYGPLVLNYKSGADTWTPGITLSDITGNVTVANDLNTSAVTANLFRGATTLLNIGPAGSVGSITLAGGSGDTGCTLDGTNGNFTCTGAISGGSIVATSVPFSGITTGTNNTGQTLTVGSTSTLTYSGTGVVNASQLEGKTWEAPGTIGSTTPNTGVFTTLTADNLLVNQYATVSASLALGATNASPGPGNLDMTGNLTAGGNVAVNGGALTTTAGTATLFNSGATTLSLGGAAATLNIGPGGATATSINLAGGSGATGCTVDGATGNFTCSGAISGSTIVATSVPFSGVTTGTNLGQTLTVGNGSTLTYTGTGVINASTLEGKTWEAPGTIGSTTPNTGAFTTLTADNLLVNQYATVSASLALGNTNASAGPGNLNMTGNLTTGGTATIAGILTVGNGTVNQIQSPYGPLVLNYKSGADTWTPGLTVSDITGNVTVANDLNSSALTANLFNTTSTTVNIGGAATTAVNVGPGGAAATSVNLAGGSAATGCTVDGATGNFTCTGTISGSSVGGTVAWSSLTNPVSPLSLTMPAGDETTFNVQSTTQTGFTWTSSTLTSGILAKYALTGTSAVATPANSGSLLTLASSTTGFTAATQTLSSVYSSGANSNSGVTVQGISSNVTNTGTTSTNIAAYLSATGASTNYALIAANGNVGIGDTSPVSLLTVGAADAFQVNSSGNIVSIGGVAHSISDSGGDLTLASNSTNITLNDNITVAGAATMSGILTVGNGTTNQIQSPYGPLVLNYKSGANAWTPGITLADITGNVTVANDLNTSATTANLFRGATTLLNIGPASNVGSITLAGGSGDTGCTVDGTNGNFTCTGTISGSTIVATSVPFSGITSATNTTAAMVVGTGASLNYTGTGTINASSLEGKTWEAPGTIGSTTPNTGVFTTLTADNLLVNQYATVSASLALGNTSASPGPGNLNMTGNLTTGGTATIAGILTVGNGTTNQIQSPYGPLVLNYKSGADTWTPGITLSDITGNVTVANDLNTSAVTANLFRGATTLLNIGPAGSVGSITLAGGSGDTGCTLDGTNGNFTCSGTISGSGITASALKWNALTNPDGNLSLGMGTNTTTFNWATGTGANNLFSFTTDNSSNGTGYLLNLATGTSSTVKPLHVSATGTEALMVDAAGNVGIGTTAPSAKLAVSGTATVSGELTVGNGTTNDIRSPYGPLTLSYKSGADTWTPGITLADITGNVTVANDLNTSATTANLFRGATTLLNIGPASNVGSITLAGGSGDTGCTVDGTNGNFTCTGTISGSSIVASSVPFSGITTGTNNTGQTLTVGNTSTLTYSGSGVINASQLEGKTWEAPGTIGSTTPNTGVFTTLTADNLLVNQYATVSASLALGNTNASAGPGNLNMTGNLTTGGTASVSGNLTIGNGSAIQSAYGPLTLNYKSGADTWTPSIVIHDVSGNIDLAGGSGSTGCTIDNTAGTITCTGGISAGSVPFSGITTGNNLGQTLTVDNGSTLTYTGTGVINASTLEGKTWEAPGTIGSTTPNTAAFTTLSSSGTSNIGSGTGVVTVNSSGALNLTGALPSTLSLGANALTITTSNFNLSSGGLVTLNGGLTPDLTTPAATSLTIDSGTTGALNFGTGANAKTITVGNNTTTTALNLTSGTGNIALSSTNLITLIASTATRIGGATTYASFGTAGDITFVNAVGGSTITGPAGGALTVAAGAGQALTLTGNAGSVWSTTAGNINLEANGAATGNIQIGVGGAGSTTPDLLVLDVKSDAGDPAGTNGAMYYNANSNKMRCYQNGAWTDCGSGSGTNFWQLNGVVLSPANSTYDLTVGGTATGSAFQVFGAETTTSGLEKLTSTVTQTGDVFSATASAITSGNMIKLGTGGNNGNFTGNGLFMDFANTGGSSFTGNFLKFNNAGATKFAVDSTGMLTLASGDTIANGSAGTITLTPGSGTTETLVTATATTVNLFNSVATTLNIGGAATTLNLANGNTAAAINIGNGTGGNTIDIGNGVNTSAQIINIADGAAAANSTVNILGGVATSGTQTLNLATGASAKTVNIGNGTGATALNLTSGTGSQTHTSSTTTGLTTSGSFVFANSSITSGDLIYANAGSGSFTGDFLKLDNNATTKATIDASGNISSLGVLQTGVATNSVAYNRLGTSTAASTSITTNNDLLISGDLEVVGGIYLSSSKIIWNVVSGVSTAAITLGQTPTSIGNNNSLGYGSWLVENTVNDGMAALMVNQGKAVNDIFDASQGGSLKFSIANNGDTSIGPNGTGKATAGTFDPPYTINGGKYATYLPGMTGVKEETMGNAITSEYVPGKGYRYVIDFNSPTPGGDLWLFSKATDIKNNIDSLVALLTPSDDTKTWYEVDKINYKLAIYSSKPTEVSYRLSGPRFDSANHTNTRNGGMAGFVLNIPDVVNTNEIATTIQTLSSYIITKVSDGVYTIQDGGGTVIDGIESIGNFVAANIRAGAIQTQEIVAPKANVGLISPIAGGTDISLQIGNTSTDSGKLAIQNAQGTEVASIDTQGNATFSGTVHSQNIDSIQALLNQVATDQSVLLAATASSSLSASSSANLASLITGDLYVTNQAAINALSVTNSLTVGTDMVIGAGGNTINSLSAPLKIQSLAMAPIEIMDGLVTIDTHGNVNIAGNLNVAGKITTPELDAGIINATGSATLSSLTTPQLVVAAADATAAGTIVNGVITTNSTVGKAVIPALTSEITIKNPKITDYTLVYVTPTSSTQNFVLYIKSKQAGQFVVGFDNPLPIDVAFNWWIVQVQ